MRSDLGKPYIPSDLLLLINRNSEDKLNTVLILGKICMYLIIISEFIAFLSSTIYQTDETKVHHC
jgi:hypothetical protein